MKSYAFPITLLIVLMASVSGWFLTYRPVEGQAEAERSQDGLRGEVKEVVVETAPLLNRFGDWVEAAGSLESRITYTPQGRPLEVNRYRSDNTLDYRLQYRFEDGRLVEETSFGPDDEPLYKWLHAYDDKGRLTSLSGYDDRGKLEIKTLYTYDDKNRLHTETSYGADELLSYEAEQRYGQGYTRSTVYYAQNQPEYRLEEIFDEGNHRLSEASYSPSQDLQYRVVYSYTPQGGLLTESAYDSNGNLQYRLENRYDTDARLLETTEYDADDEPFYRYSYAYNDSGDLTKRESRGVDGSGSTLTYTYTYDGQGNWTERRTSKLVSRFGEEIVEPSEVTRRTISYY